MPGLAAAARAASFRVVRHETLTSTMEEAARLARAGDEGGVWVVAERQTGGRGRNGRVWVSEPGNLYATLLLVDPCPIALGPQLSFVSGLALCDAARRLTGFGERIRLKWPNDVLVDGAKLSGVLLESLSYESAHGGRRNAILIGCGVNVRHHPTDLAYEAASLLSLGIDRQPSDMLDELCDAFRARLAQWRAGEGFAATRADWLAMAAGVGGPVKVSLPEGVLSGLFETLDPSGRLMLRSDGGLRAIDAGDVVLRKEPA